MQRAALGDPELRATWERHPFAVVVVQHRAAAALLDRFI